MKKAKIYLLYLLPIVLLFSYYPVISLGQNETMNFELSLPLFWLVLFFFASIPDLFQFFTHLNKTRILSLLFPLYLTISIIWSPNKPRAILTAGVFWLVVFAIISIIQTFKDKNVVKNTTLKTRIVKIFLISTSVICVFCWLQCLLDSLGVNHETTLLCPGCTYQIFGFPHPNGFAIEPQFMGNLLLAPSVLVLYLLIIRKRKLYAFLSLLFTSTLFLTLSRGAIYSFIIGIAFFIVYYLIHKQKRALIAIPIIIVSALISFLAQGIFSELSPANETFYSGIAKSVHQLSLGAIDIRQKPAEESSKEPEQPEDSRKEEAQFNGYIESSTTMRLSLNEYALNTWSKTPTIAIFGTGIGGAGMTVAQTFENFSPKEIIHNEYLSLLLEFGILGCILLIFPIFLFIKTIFKNRLGWLFAITLAFALSILFFSGLPNALHIFIFPALLLFLSPAITTSKS